MKYVRSTCKIGQEAKCCRYLAAGSKGFECLKHSNLKELLDNRAMLGQMHARADNCEGWDDDRAKAN